MRRFYKKHRKLKIALTIVILLLLALAVTIGVMLWQIYKDAVKVVPKDQVDYTASEVQIAQEDQKDDEVVNVLLVGSDSRDPDLDLGRSDSMMLLSYNKIQNRASVVSFLRDTLVDIEGYGKSRLGHTMAYGGVGLTVNTINSTFDLDIQNYITINFESLVSVIDQMGGITVQINAEEAEYYRENGMPDIEEGAVAMTGSQALAYARNRTLGGDFARTRRQRTVMYGVYQKFRENPDPSNILSLINFCVGQVKTNMSVTDIYNLAMSILQADNLDVRQSYIPNEGLYTDITYNGMAVLEIDLEANKEYLHKLLYPGQE